MYLKSMLVISFWEALNFPGSISWRTLLTQSQKVLLSTFPRRGASWSSSFWESVTRCSWLWSEAAKVWWASAPRNRVSVLNDSFSTFSTSPSSGICIEVQARMATRGLLWTWWIMWLRRKPSVSMIHRSLSESGFSPGASAACPLFFPDQTAKTGPYVPVPAFDGVCGKPHLLSLLSPQNMFSACILPSIFALVI